MALLLGCGLLAPALVGAQENQEPQGTPAEETPGDAPQPQESAADRGPTPAASVPLRAGSTAPPKNLKKVGDHWTPYTPPDPESFPPDATLHIIVPGDTLWDLADLAFGNPYLWPQIWNENRYILDSHWIYPGDPLLLPARPTVVSEIVPQGQQGAPPTSPVEPPVQEAPAAEMPAAGMPAAEMPAPAPAAAAVPAAPQAAPESAHAPRAVPKVTPFADEADLRCGGFIAQQDTRADYFISNQEEEGKVGISEGDIIYLNRGRQNGHVDPGTEYSVVVREGEVRHPMTQKLIGFYYKRLGTVQVLAAQEETAIAIISMACDEIRTGYDLVSLTVTPMRSRPAPPFNRIETLDSSKPSGYVVHASDNMERVGTGYLVDIDLGYEDGLKPGDFLKLYLPAEPYDKYRKVKYDYQWNNRRFQSLEERRDDRSLPPAKIIGQLVVLTTERHTATAKVIYAVREITVGTQVELY
jgi:nucleoid-associated protein YgaU